MTVTVFSPQTIASLLSAASCEGGFIMLPVVRSNEVWKLLQMRGGGGWAVINDNEDLLTCKGWWPRGENTVAPPPIYCHLIFGSSPPHSLVRIQLLLPGWPLTSLPPRWTSSSDPDSGTTVNLPHHLLFYLSDCYPASKWDLITLFLV